MDPGLITSGISAVLGLFSKKKRNPLDVEAEKNARKLSGRIDKYNTAVDNYDPEKNDREAIDFAQNKAEHALEVSQRTNANEFFNAGGVVGRDTNWAVGETRRIGDIQNGLTAMLANWKQSQVERKMQALASSVQVAKSGDLTNTFANLAQIQKSDAGNSSGMQSVLGGVIDGFLKKKPGKKDGTDDPYSSRTLGDGSPDWGIQGDTQDANGIPNYGF